MSAKTALGLAIEERIAAGKPVITPAKKSEFAATFRSAVEEAAAVSPFNVRTKFVGMGEDRYSLRDLANEVEGGSRVGRMLQEAIEDEAQSAGRSVQQAIKHFATEHRISFGRQPKARRLYMPTAGKPGRKGP